MDGGERISRSREALTRTYLEGIAETHASPFAAASVKALKGGAYRLRVGEYRILFTIETEILLVLVVKVGHRRDVYRG